MSLFLFPALLAAFLLSLGLNRLMIELGPKLGLMDQPDERRVHTTPVPRAGGLAIWVAFLTVAHICESFVPSLGGLIPIDTLYAFAWSSSILMVVGVIDDRRGVPAKLKLLGHIAAAAAFYALRPNGMANISGIAIPQWMDALLFIGWAVVLINAYNLIDGLDGLCGGLATIATLVLGTMALINGRTGEAILLFLMASALCGFLWFNFNPARIFLGDAGSMMLGFFIAAAATQAVGRRAVLGTLLLPIAVAGVPLLDVLLAVWRRSARNLSSKWTGGERVGVFSPDKDHLHHRFLASGMNQRRVALLMQGCAVLLSVLAFLPMLFGTRVVALSVMGLLMVALMGLRQFARIELVQTGSILHFAIKRPNARRRLRFASYLYDTAMLVLSALAAMMIETNYWFRSYGPDKIWLFTLVFMILGTVALRLAKTYSRVWSRATLRDFATLAGWLAMAGVISMTTMIYVERDLAWGIVRVSMLATTIASCAIALPRSAPELLREWALDASHRRFGKTKGNERQLLVYGAGEFGCLFTSHLKNSPPDLFRNSRIAGFIDDKAELKGRLIRGFPVLGSLDDLETLRMEHPIDGIIVTIDKLQPEKHQQLEALAKHYKLALYFWQVELKPVNHSAPPPAGQS